MGLLVDDCVTQKRDEEIFECLKSGDPYADIAERFGVRRQIVTKVAARMGYDVSVRRFGPHPRLKPCAGCGQSFPGTDKFFSRYPGGKFRGKCKPCRAEEERVRVRSSPERKKAATYAWRKANLVKVNASAIRAKMKRKYSITPEQYEETLKAQGGQCAICKGTNGGGLWGKMVVDHREGTNTMRALLCHNCNTVLGLMKEDPDRLRAAAEYLETHGAIRSGVGLAAKTKRIAAKQEPTHGIFVHV